VRRPVCERLARYCDDYRSKKDLLPLVDEILFPVNGGAAQSESSLTLAEFVEKLYLPDRRLPGLNPRQTSGLWANCDEI